jgi:chromosome segregation ATPase
MILRMILVCFLLWLPLAPAILAAEAKPLPATTKAWDEAVTQKDKAAEAVAKNESRTALGYYLDALERFELVYARWPAWNEKLVAHEILECRSQVLVLEKKLGYAESSLWDKPTEKELALVKMTAQVQEMEKQQTASRLRQEELEKENAELRTRTALLDNLGVKPGDGVAKAVLDRLREQTKALTLAQLQLQEEVKKRDATIAQLKEQYATMEKRMLESPRSEAKLQNDIMRLAKEKEILQNELIEARDRIEIQSKLLTQSGRLAAPAVAKPGVNPDAIGMPAVAAVPADLRVKEAQSIQEDQAKRIAELQAELKVMKLARPVEVKDFELINENERLERRLTDLEIKCKELQAENEKLKKQAEKDAAAKAAAEPPKPEVKPEVKPAATKNSETAKDAKVAK